jgi:glycosyltransferase involved in cell wall biosynthesis
MTRNLTLWVFNHYAETPDGSATRTFELCRALAGRGHAPTIFASSFSHYRHREEHLQGWGRFSATEERDGVRFVWLRGRPYRGNDWRRVVNMLGYGALSMVYGVRMRPKPDVIIGCSVHPCAALSGLAIARLLGARFLLEITDLWPQVLIDMGRLSPGGASARILRAIERGLFAAAEKVIMLWRDTHDYVRSRGMDPGKIVWIPHVIDPGHFETVPPYRDRRGRFTALYLGSFVKSMGLETLLEASRILRTAGRTDIRIVMVGAGAEKDRLRRHAARLGLDNLEMRDPVPKAQVPWILAGADCLICCFRNSPAYRYGLSMNKLCDYLMSGRPVILSGNSGYDPVAEGRAGLSVKGEDPETLAAAIIAMADLAFEERAAMGLRGRDWALRHHDIRVLADRLERVLLPGSSSATCPT